MYIPLHIYLTLSILSIYLSIYLKDEAKLFQIGIRFIE